MCQQKIYTAPKVNALLPILGMTDRPFTVGALYFADMIRTTFPKKQKLIRTKIPKNKSGIYMIRSEINGKIYIGSSVDLFRRKNSHIFYLKNKNHHSIHLQNHVNKYEKEDLTFGIIEFCPKEKLIEREQYWIDALNPKFNICQIAYSCLGIKRSEKFKQNLSNYLKTRIISQETKDKIRKTLKGHSVSEETRQKMKGKISKYKGIPRTTQEKQKISLAKIGHSVSEETRQKLSNAHKGRKHTEEQKLKNSQSHLGHFVSSETKVKIRNANKKIRIALLIIN